MAERDRLSLSPDQVEQLAALLDGEGVRSLHLETPRGRLALQLGPDGASPGAATVVISSVTVGEFLLAHPGHAATPVRVGDPLTPGDLLGFIRVGVLLVPVVFAAEAGRRAVLGEVLVADRTLVGYGTPLFQVVLH